MRRHRVFVATAATLLFAAAPAAAVPDAEYSFQIDLSTSPRTFEDASVIQFALPRSKITVRAGGRLRRVTVHGFTVGGPEGTTEIVRRLRGRYPNVQDVIIDRPLTAAEKRYAVGKLVWIDGDVLAVHPSNPLCAAGTTLAKVRAILKGSSRVLVPSGTFGEPEHLFGVGRYGSGPRATFESEALFKVAREPATIAAVAWSGARDELAAGKVCAVPIGGVTPTETTLRDRSYPAAVHATHAYARTAYRGYRSYIRRWYRGFLTSEKIRNLLLTTRGRERLLP